MAAAEWDPLADTKLVLFDAAVGESGELAMSALRIRRWKTASTHVGQKHPVSPERARQVAGHPSLGARGYTSVPLERAPMHSTTFCVNGAGTSYSEECKILPGKAAAPGSSASAGSS